MKQNNTKHRSRYIVGIDLGTTNSAVSYIDTRKHPFGGVDAIAPFPVAQVVAEGEVAKREGLPSFLYLSAGHDLPEGSLDLPWSEMRDFVVGEFARVQGAKVPGRLISSAKSWLCHPGVDRRAPILPWGDVGEIKKRSPVDAAAAYLQHMCNAWNHTMAQTDATAGIEAQEVVLTVPASFDEIARELTLEAAGKAGMAHVTLLEEPQAAFYSWIARRESQWDQTIGVGSTVLVCDIGGGTTDFSLIQIKETDTGPVPERVAVGEHLLLGGDNMDLALARRVERQMPGEAGKRLDSLRWHILTAQCRSAKEEILGERRDKVPISVPGRGRGVVAGALSAELTKDDVRETIIQGFFPDTRLDEMPDKRAGLGIQEWGLPFVEDPIIPRHLAAFLKRYGLSGKTDAPKPDAIFLNGGVFGSKAIGERLIHIVSDWFASETPGRSLTVLENNAPALAVSQGAAYYGMVRRGRGVRIVGGGPRTYYVGVVPTGDKPEPGNVTAVCVVPRGMEEGETVEIETPEFRVLANQPVSFSLYSSNDRLGDQPGQVVTLAEESLVQLPPLRTVLRFGKKDVVRKIPVSLCAHLTEIGTTELSFHARNTEHRWRLQFDIRPAAEPSEKGEETAKASEKPIHEASLVQAIEIMKEAFAAGATPREDRVTPATVMQSLRKVTGIAKETWPMPVVRRFADELLKHPQYRTTSPRHEERWLNLVGFCLRPGYGYGGDDYRIRQLLRVYYEGVLFGSDSQCQVETWVLWRRVAGGLQQKQQMELFRDLASELLPGRKKGARTRKVFPRERNEMWRTVANLERLPVNTKEEIANALLKQVGTSKGEGLNMWVLSRIGSRVPLYGPLDAVIPARTVTDWLGHILETDWKKPEHTAACVVQMACFTGDRERDIDGVVKDRIRRRLEGIAQAERWIQRLDEFVSLSRVEEDWLFGEELPGGLHLAE